MSKLIWIKEPCLTPAHGKSYLKTYADGSVKCLIIYNIGDNRIKVRLGVWLGNYSDPGPSGFAGSTDREF